MNEYRKRLLNMANGKYRAKSVPGQRHSSVERLKILMAKEVVMLSNHVNGKQLTLRM